MSNLDAGVDRRQQVTLRSHVEALERARWHVVSRNPLTLAHVRAKQTLHPRVLLDGSFDCGGDPTVPVVADRALLCMACSAVVGVDAASCPVCGHEVPR